MHNVLMEFCRKQFKVSKIILAKKLQVSLKDYDDIESGKILLTRAQAIVLGKVYGASSTFFLVEAEQLDFCLASLAVRDSLKSENKELKGLRSGGVYKEKDPTPAIH